MARQNRVTFTNDREGSYPLTREYSGGVAGNMTSTTAWVFMVRNPGTLKHATMCCGINGADVSNPLNVALQVKNVRTGNNMLLTAATIDKTAGAGFQTTENTGATGITPAIFDPANQTLSPGDLIKITITVTRTTPGTEFADVAFKVGYIELTDWDPVLGVPTAMPADSDQT